MKGDAKVIEFLNQALKNELTAINQYFLHSRMLRDWGVSELAKKEHDESIEEMHHAECPTAASSRTATVSCSPATTRPTRWRSTPRR